MNDKGNLRVPQVDNVIDCGCYVNSQGIRKQMDGAAIHGNTLARHGHITTRKGAVNQNDFHDYRITRMGDSTLDVRVHIRGGLREPATLRRRENGVPPYPPARVNAIYDATGKRIRRLPLGERIRPA